MKSVTTLKDEEIGFLKGGLEEKMEPFVYSYMYIFEKILKNKKILHKLRENDIIKILPLAYIRGVNLDNSIVIIDEAQNLTKDHMITIMTRLGSNSKMIFLGDTDQIDRNKKQESALSWLLETFSNFEGIQTIRLTNEDVVRNPLVSKIIDHLKNNQEL
jgi:phosphate starvation-inducible PhoH-like protein